MQPGRWLGTIPSEAGAPRRRESATRSSNLSSVDTTASRSLALSAANAAADKKGSEIRILDLGDLLGITDFFVLVSATNERQLGTVADEIERRLKADCDRVPRRREGTKDTGWLLLDYGDIVVHAFTEQQRAYYDLERLWSDAPTVPFDELAAVDSASDGR